jgi:hypothetical protein
MSDRRAGDAMGAAGVPPPARGLATPSQGEGVLVHY